MVLEQGMYTEGFPRNLGDQHVSSKNEPARKGAPGPTPWPKVVSLHHLWEQSQERCRGTAERRKRSDAGRACWSRSV